MELVVFQDMVHLSIGIRGHDAFDDDDLGSERKGLHAVDALRHELVFWHDGEIPYEGLC